MDFAYSHIDMECSLSNPLVAASFLLSSLPVAFGVAWALSRLRPIPSRLGLSVAVLIVGGFASVVVCAFLFRAFTKLQAWNEGMVNVWTAQIGCMNSPPSWAYPALVVTLTLIATVLHQLWLKKHS